MKKHLSVFMLIMRTTIYKILAVLAVMALAQGILFGMNLSKIAGGGFGCPTFASIMSDCCIGIIFGLAFAIISTLLICTGAEFGGSKVRYTLQRLQIREEIIFLWQALYIFMVYIVLWAAQVGLFLIFAKFYMDTVPADKTSAQSIFMAFYANDFMHNILPLADGSRYVRNLLHMATLAVSMPMFGFKMRRDEKKYIVPFIFLGMSFTMYRQTRGNFGLDVFYSIVFILIICITLYGLWSEYKDEKNKI